MVSNAYMHGFASALVGTIRSSDPKVTAGVRIKARLHALGNLSDAHTGVSSLCPGSQATHPRPNNGKVRLYGLRGATSALPNLQQFTQVLLGYTHAWRVDLPTGEAGHQFHHRISQ